MMRGQLPHSDEAEKGVLSCMFQDKAAAATAAAQLTDSQFYIPANLTLFCEIARLWNDGKPIELLSFTQHLRDAKLMAKIGGEGIVEKIWWLASAPGYVQHYIDAVRDKSIQRQIIKTSGENAKRAYESQDVPALLAECQAELCAIGHSNAVDIPISTHVERALEELEEAINHQGKKDRISTGLVDLDRKLTISPSDLVVVSAETSAGKTALSLNIVEHNSIIEKKGSMVFSVEMPAKQLIFRMMASQGKVNIQNAVELCQKEQVAKLTAAAGKIRTAPIYIEDDPDLTVMQIRAKTRKKIQERPEVNLIVVDYLQILADSGKKDSNESQELSSKALMLKRMARELKVAVILLSQENDEGKLFGSRGPKHHADTHLRIVHNDDGAYIVIDKQRNGPRNKAIKVSFLEIFTRFENAARSDPK